MKIPDFQPINIKESKGVKVTEEMIAEAERLRDNAQLMLSLVDYVLGKGGPVS